MHRRRNKHSFLAELLTGIKDSISSMFAPKKKRKRSVSKMRSVNRAKPKSGFEKLLSFFDFKLIVSDKKRLTIFISACAGVVAIVVSLFLFGGQPSEVPEDSGLEVASVIEAVPTPEPTPAYDAVDLEKGDVIRVGTKNPLVGTISEKLMFLLYLGEDEPSMEYSESMGDAVTLFQRDNELEQTGEVDNVTYVKLMDPQVEKYSVGIGTKGTDVEELQIRLMELGYLDAVTQYFGTDTEAAVKKFQSRNNLTEDGRVREDTRELLYSPSAVANEALKEGDESPEIKKIQERLKQLGYLLSTPDGKYGKGTVAAVERFQTNNGLIADGHVGPQTRNILMSKDAINNALSIGISGDDVKSVQQQLRKLGYLASVTGYFGSDTDAAVRNFQKLNKLSVDGKVGAQTMNVLTSKKAKAASGKAAVVTGPNANSLVIVARSKLGSKYVLGAKGPERFDCSGYVYWCLNKVGVKIGYMTSATWQNVSRFQRYTSMGQIRKGDILSFRGHVGIALSNGMMIDASSGSGRVRTTSLGTPYWRNNWVCGYRIF